MMLRLDIQTTLHAARTHLVAQFSRISVFQKSVVGPTSSTHSPSNLQVLAHTVEQNSLNTATTPLTGATYWRVTVAFDYMFSATYANRSYATALVLKNRERYLSVHNVSHVVPGR